jgi:hypothetical protein
MSPVSLSRQSLASDAKQQHGTDHTYISNQQSLHVGTAVFNEDPAAAAAAAFDGVDLTTVRSSL